jgi:iron(III) transport system permease protein
MGIVVIGLLGYQRSLGLQKKYVTVTGKASPPVPQDVGRWRYVGAAVIFVYIFLAVVLPLVVLIVSSFQKFYGAPWFPMVLTTANYRAIFDDSSFVGAIINSAIVSTSGAAICVALGLLVAYLVTRGTHPVRKLVDVLATAAVAFPGIVLGLALLWTYVQFPVPIYGTIFIIIIALVTIRLPYANRFAASTLQRLSTDLEEASAVTGSAWLRTMRRIVLPLTAPALASAFLILFIMMLRDISTVVLLYSYNTVILSVLLTNRLLDGIYVQAAALTVILIVLMLFVWLIASRFLRSPLQAIK